MLIEGPRSPESLPCRTSTHVAYPSCLSTATLQPSRPRPRYPRPLHPFSNPSVPRPLDTVLTLRNIEHPEAIGDWYAVSSRETEDDARASVAFRGGGRCEDHRAVCSGWTRNARNGEKREVSTSVCRSLKWDLSSVRPRHDDRSPRLKHNVKVRQRGKRAITESTTLNPKRRFIGVENTDILTSWNGTRGVL